MAKFFKFLKELFLIGYIIGFRKLFFMNKAHIFAVKYLRGYFITECFKCLLDMGFFDYLKKNGNINIKDYSLASNIDYKYLKSVCDYLYTVKILNKRDGDSYFLDKVGAFIIDYAKGPFYFVNAYAPIIENMSALLKKPKGQGKAFLRDERYVSMASTETERWIPYPIIANLIRKHNIKNVLDLGCGNGEFIIKLSSDNPSIFCYGIDISSISIKSGIDKIEFLPQEVKNRLNLSVFDIFTIKEFNSSKADKIEVVILMFVLHEFLKYGTDRVSSLLVDLRKVFRNSQLVICEVCQISADMLRRKPSLIAEHHLFHALSDQRILTYDEWHSIFKNIGLEIIEEINFSPASQSYFLLK